MVVLLRRAGIFHCYCDLSIKDCTELEVLDVFRYENTGIECDFELCPIPIFAPPKLVKQYQEQMGRMVGFTEVAMMRYQASQSWCNALENLTHDAVLIHQDPGFWYEEHCLDNDANLMHRMCLKQARSLERGDVTLVAAFIELGVLMSSSYLRLDIFRRKVLSEKAIVNMHEAMFDLPEGYYKEPKYHPLESYGEPIDEAWPSGMEEQIRRSAIMQARVQGPCGQSAWLPAGLMEPARPAGQL